MRTFIFTMLCVFLSSCSIYYSFKIPHKDLTIPEKNEICKPAAKNIYLKTFYNFSYTHENGDTLIYSLDTIPKATMYHLDDLQAAFSKYIDNFGYEVMILPNERTSNGTHLNLDIEEIRNAIKETYQRTENNDSSIIYWITNRNRTKEYDGTPYGSLNSYHFHYSITSYVLIVENGKICYFNGVRTFSNYGLHLKLFEKSVSLLFDPYYNPSGKKTRRSK